MSEPRPFAVQPSTEVMNLALETVVSITAMSMLGVSMMTQAFGIWMGSVARVVEQAQKTAHPVGVESLPEPAQQPVVALAADAFEEPVAGNEAQQDLASVQVAEIERPHGRMAGLAAKFGWRRH